MADSKIESQPLQRAITPFWRLLPLFLRFPFRTRPLIFLGSIVLASALAGMLPGAIGLLAKGILVYLGLRYGFNVLDLFAKGRYQSEPVDHKLWGAETRPAKLGLMAALFISFAVLLGNALVASRMVGNPSAQQQLIDRYQRENAAKTVAPERERAAAARGVGLAPTPLEQPTLSGVAVAPPPTARTGPSRAEILRDARLGPTDPLWFQLLPPWYWALLVGVSFLWPAATLVIALDDRFFKALNPLRAPHFIHATGPAYFALWTAFLLIVGVMQGVLAVGEHWPVVLRLPLEMGLGTYLGLVLCALVGYTLYECHDELHRDVEVDFRTEFRAGVAEPIAAAGVSQPSQALERRVEQLLAAGELKDALDELKVEMRHDHLDPELNTRLHALYLRHSDKAHTLAHGPQWLKALLRAGRIESALAGYRELQAIDPGFEIQDGDAIAPLAQLALQHGERETALALLRGFDKRFPGHKDLPLVVFLGARLLSEHGHQHANAAQMLRTLLQRHPAHQIASEAGRYLARLERTTDTIR